MRRGLLLLPALLCLAAETPTARAAPTATDIATAYARGRDAYLAKRWAQAIPIFQWLWNNGQRRPDIAGFLGYSHCRAGNIQAGMAALQAIPGSALNASQRTLFDQTRAMCQAKVATAYEIPAAQVFTAYSSTISFSAELLYFGQSKQLRFAAAQGDGSIPADRLWQRLAPVAHAAARSRAERRLRQDLAKIAPAASGCPVTPDFALTRRGRFLFVSHAAGVAGLSRDWASPLEDFAVSLEQQLDIPAPRETITIYLAACPQDGAAIARAMHGVTFDPEVMKGYSVHEDMSLLALWGGYIPSPSGPQDSDLMRTLRHELAHLMLRNWFGDMPAWLEEGLAQYLGVTADGPQPARETVLPGSWGGLPTLRAVVTAKADDVQPSETCIGAAQKMMEADVARMALAYLASQPGALRAFLVRLHAVSQQNGNLHDPAVIEQALVMSLEEWDAAYRKNSLIRSDDSLFHQADGAQCPA